MKKVAIITTGHPPKDERIFNKIAYSLKKNGYTVSIICSTQDISTIEDGIAITGFDQNTKRASLFRKIKFLLQLLNSFQTDICHACEPMAVFICWIYKWNRKDAKRIKIINDVTEWYPENIVQNSSTIIKLFKFIFGHIFNLLASNLSDIIILGEEYKRRRYDLYAPKKKKFIVSYFPILSHYNSSTRKFDGKEIIFGFAGVISASRGLKIISDALAGLKERNSTLNIKFILAGRFENENEKSLLDQMNNKGITVEHFGWRNYSEFSKCLEPAHICFDLRPANGIYEKSLPIKIFDYMALGKCIIASNYKPIADTFKIANCGILVNPINSEEIITEIENLMNDPRKITEYGDNGRKAAEKLFNWKTCEVELLRAYNS